MEKTESLDDQIQVSCSFILHGRIGDLKRLRQRILDFLGAEMTPEGHIHQPKPSTSIFLIHHTLSREKLWTIKERDWRILREVKGEL